MKLTLPTQLRCAAALGLAAFLPASLLAETLNWTGAGTTNSTYLNNAANWTPSTAPGATSDLVIANLEAASGSIGSLLMGSSYTINSISFDNLAQRYNSDNGLRIVSTTSNTLSTVRELSFGSAGSIMNLSHDADVQFRATSYASTSGSPSLTLNLAFSGLGSVNIDATSQLTITAGNTTITGAGGLLKTGAGTLTLSGSHTYSGGFVLEQGTVRFTTSGASNGDGTEVANSAWGTGVLTLRGGGLESTGAAGGDPGTVNRTIRSEIHLDGTVAIGSAATGNITVTTAAGKATTLLSNSTLDVGGFATWNQNISGAYSLTKSGEGTLTLNGDNSYTGGTIVSAGTLKGDSAGLQGDIVNHATLIFNQTGDGLYAGSLSGSGSFIKDGAGKLILTASSSHTGLTTISAGALVLDGVTFGGTGNAGLTVASGATLSGHGLVNGPAIFAAGSMLVTNGTLEFNSTLDVSAAAGSSGLAAFSVDLAGLSGAAFLVHDTLSIGDGLLDLSDFDFASGAAFSAGTYTLFASDAAIAGSLGAGLTGEFDGLLGTLAFADSGKAIQLTLAASAIPEPSTYALLFGALAGAIALYRRRQRT